ncbi:uncharacterized protein LOC144145879 isoform X2 [Haemaphysalis longicornis]
MSQNNCCVVGCSNTYKNSPGTRFYPFPGRPYEYERRERWIAAVRRKREDGSPWVPTKNSRICSKHFAGGVKSNDPRNPAYIPTIFPAAYGLSNSSTADNCQRLLCEDSPRTNVLACLASSSMESPEATKAAVLPNDAFSDTYVGLSTESSATANQSSIAQRCESKDRPTHCSTPCVTATTSLKSREALSSSHATNQQTDNTHRSLKQQLQLALRRKRARRLARRAPRGASTHTDIEGGKD